MAGPVPARPLLVLGKSPQSPNYCRLDGPGTIGHTLEVLGLEVLVKYHLGPPAATDGQNPFSSGASHVFDGWGSWPANVRLWASRKIPRQQPPHFRSLSELGPRLHMIEPMRLQLAERFAVGSFQAPGF